MFSRKEKEPIPDFSDVYVKLKPLFGISPGVYLTVLYGFLLLFVIFMIFFFPGLKAFGAYIHFHSVPDSAGVWVDGVYKGSTPCRVFVPKGIHRFELKKAYYRTFTSEERVPGRIFGTLFFPLHRKFLASIEIDDLNGLLEWTFEEWASWGMLNRFALNYQLPRLLSEAALVVWTSPQTNRRQIQDRLAAFLNQTAFFVDSPEELKEIIRALTYLEVAGGIPDAMDWHRIMRRTEAFLSSHKTFPYWLLLSLPLQRSLSSTGSTGVLTAERLASSESFKAFHVKYMQYLASFSEQVQTGGRDSGSIFMLENIPFRYIPGGSIIIGKEPQQALDRIDQDLPYPAVLRDFYMAETELTNEQFRVFLLENPEWSGSNRDSLEARGEVSQDYLSDWQRDAYPEGRGRSPVTGVSYNAAKAYCQWLTTKLPASFAGYEVRLPHDEEWEWAARAGRFGATQNNRTAASVFGRDEGPVPADRAQPNPFGLKNMLGNVWEWCEDWYFPAKNLLVERLPLRVADSSRGNSNGISGGSERIVRGGCWANAEEDIRFYTRGSQHPSWCTPYLGFRVVIARK
jgi:iron(II)-dependent oxidoreductase